MALQALDRKAAAFDLQTGRKLETSLLVPGNFEKSEAPTGFTVERIDEKSVRVSQTGTTASTVIRLNRDINKWVISRNAKLLAITSGESVVVYSLAKMFD
jgi:hypothetical protein